MRRAKTDVLILGAGGAGLFAALHARAGAPEAKISLVVKGLMGKCGCTRMVQGGYNVALADGDSIERHFMDTIEGGKWLNNQELAWRLVSEAPRRVRELENELGCYFDRNPDGSMHQKAFAGQTFDRTVHKGDLTGIEIVNRLAEQVWARDIERLEEYRALSLIPSRDGSRLSGVLLLDIRTGEFVFQQARAVLLATGGGPTMYKYHTPSGDKSCDGMAMALRAGMALRDMEMVQFHPTGLLAGTHTRMTGTVLEEGLRGAGGYLLGGDGERFMHRYDPREERATRDVVSRGIFQEIRKGNVTPNGGVYIEMGHLGAERVRKQFPGMVRRCADCGFDLAGGQVEVIPTAHYLMGGVEFAADCQTTLDGLFAAGEDTGGVHGANRLGGNGVANSTVFGGLAGDSIARYLATSPPWVEPDENVLSESEVSAKSPLSKPPGDLEAVREKLFEVMWEDVGIVRNESGLRRASERLAELDSVINGIGVSDRQLAFNLTWHDWLNLKNLILVSRAIAASALYRENSRGAHFREDYPEPGDLEASDFNRLRLAADGRIEVEKIPVQFTRVRPGGNAGQMV